ncbi:hypothetical protein QCE47_27920 [Caballeronia sp. LZ025]|uniref:hypothetical protein n=1 Tax=Caballeronia TaxID=1827195 RepID=UPI001FD5BB10|nr:MULTISPECIES: hypothetical protein [Caballeronia]MDR5736144.1 hypothetical protein [Caballeronia sp. LZ025]
MVTEAIQARRQLRNAQQINDWMQNLVDLLKSDAADQQFHAYGLTRKSAPGGHASELCIEAHLRPLVTVRDHVFHPGTAARTLYGRVRLFDVVDGKPTGECYLSIIVRHDGFISFDGTTDVQTPLDPVHGFKEDIITGFASAALIAVQGRLAEIH